MASRIVVDHLECISTEFKFSVDNIEPLVQTCMTALSSKKVTKQNECSIVSLIIESLMGQINILFN
jgi:hypothetical protein